MDPKIPNNHLLPRANPRPAPEARAGHPPNTPIQGISVIFAGIAHFLAFPFFFSPIPLTFAALILSTMLAVVKIAGQQFKVQKDQTLYVPRIAGNAGDKVEFAEVLLSHG